MVAHLALAFDPVGRFCAPHGYLVPWVRKGVVKGGDLVPFCTVSADSIEKDCEVFDRK